MSEILARQPIPSADIEAMGVLPAFDKAAASIRGSIEGTVAKAMTLTLTEALDTAAVPSAAVEETVANAIDDE